MNRLTNNKEVSEMGMVELAHNSCYVKNKETWYRDYSSDMTARQFTRKLLVKFAEGDDAFTCDEDFDEYITTCLEDGTDSIEGLIALFYRNLWAMADLRERLKEYEELEDQNRLLKLPCAMGDTVWDNDFGKPCGYKVTGFSFGNLNDDYYEDEIPVFDQIIVYYSNSNGSVTGNFAVSEIGITVFLTQEEAEAALRADIDWN